jgi:hypothetical protein
MAQEDLSSLRRKVDDLERRLGVGQKEQISERAAASADARKGALQLPDTGKSQEIASQIAAIADSQNVLVEWTAREVPGLALASVRCCCCCCCCIIVAGW